MNKMIKTLASQIKEFKKDSFMTPVFMILEVIDGNDNSTTDGVQLLMMVSEKGNINHIYAVGAIMVVDGRQ